MNYAISFTNDEYLTKNQVRAKMKTSFIDVHWKEIIEYRKNFAQDLSLRSLEKSRLIFVGTPNISDRINKINLRFTKLVLKLNALENDEVARSLFRQKQIKNIIENVAKKYNVETDEGFYNLLFSDNLLSIDVKQSVLVNYYKGLTRLLEDTHLPLDENYIINLSEIFNGKSVNYYRDYEVPQTNALIDKVLITAPVKRIPDLMEDLFAFEQSSNAPIFVKFSAILYYLSYVRPFPYYNEEIAILFSKAYLQRQDLEILAPYLNIETLMSDLKDHFDAIVDEVRNTVDLTYLVDFLANLFIEQIEKIEALLLENTKIMLQNERYNVSNEFNVPQNSETKVEIETEKPSLNDQQSNQTLEFEVQQKPQEEPTKEKVAPTVTNYQPVDVNPSLQDNEFGKQTLGEGTVHTTINISVKDISVGLSEEDAQKIERHLRESDPSLSRIEAYFYARHCTRGKYYTIAQFKEVTGCAYETARTSMDHLAFSGYYKKEQFKNKFLYTPLTKI